MKKILIVILSIICIQINAQTYQKIKVNQIDTKDSAQINLLKPLKFLDGSIQETAGGVETDPFYTVDSSGIKTDIRNLQASGLTMTSKQIIDSISTFNILESPYKINFRKLRNTHSEPLSVTSDIEITPDTTGALDQGSTTFQLIGDGTHTATFGSPFSSSNGISKDTFVNTNGYMSTYLVSVFGSGIYRIYKYSLIDYRTTPGAPITLSAPGSFNATAISEDSIVLSWNTVANATYYQLDSASTLNGTYATISSIIPQSSVGDTIAGLADNHEVIFRIRSLGDGVNYLTSGWAIDSATTSANDVPYYTTIGFTGTAQEADTLTGSWSGFVDPDSDPEGIPNLKWQTSADGLTGWSDISGATDTTYIIQALDVDNHLRFAVQATATAGNTPGNWQYTDSSYQVTGLSYALTLTTNSGPGDTFNPSITVSGGVASWDMGDGSTINSNTPSKSYADATTKTVNVSLGTIPNNDSIKTISGFNSKKLLSIDLSKLERLRGSIQLQGNTELASVLFPTTSQTITELYLNGLALTGVVDISGLPIAGPIYLMNNAGVTNYILNSNNTGEVTYLDASGCNITGTFDASGIHRFSGVFSLLNQTNCDSVSFTNTDNLSTNSFTTFNLAGTKIRHLDLSHITNFSGTATIGNSLLTTTIWPTSNKVLDLDINNAKYVTLDLTTLTGLRKLTFDAMSTLTSLSFPITTQVTTWLKVGGSSIQMLDISPYSHLAGEIYIWNNTLMDSIKTGTSSENINVFNLLNLKNTFKTVDLSGYPGLGGSLSVAGCTGVNLVILPTSSRNFTSVIIIGTALDSINTTSLSGAINSLNMSSNASLNIFRGFNWIRTTTTTVNFQYCSLDVESIDNILAALNAYFSANAPTTNLTLTLNGGTNAAPTGGNDNTDAVNLQAVFTAAGQTLTYVHN